MLATARRVAEIVHREGATSLWFRAWSLAGYRRAAVLCCDLTTAPKPAVPLPTFRSDPVTQAHAREYLAFRRGMRLAAFHDRLERGFECHAAWQSNRIASVTWTATTPRAVFWFLDAEFDLPPGQIYLFDSFTHPEFRGRRLQSLIFHEIRAKALSRGITRALTFVVPENRSSLSSRVRLGFRRTGLVWRVGWGRFAWHGRRGDAPILRGRT
jgi:GNAT superfamily N-acetyltransferase